MVSSVSSSAAFSTAMLSGSQCRGTRDPQAMQEKLFSKLDVNGDGGIDQSELTQFLDYASSAISGTSGTSSTSATSDTASTDLFKAMDTDGDGTLSKTELADGAKKLFDELRTQLMTASGSASGTRSTDSTSSAASAADTSSIDDTQGPPPGPPPGPAPSGGHHHGGGLFAKIASLLDQYRSTATDSTDTTSEAATTLSVAA